MTCRFVAEVGSNHNGDLDRARECIRTAANAGFAAVKFQAFQVERLFAPEILARSPAHRDRAKNELPHEWLPELAERCRRAEVLFGCSVFDVENVGLVAPHVDFLKVSSYEILYVPLLEACADAGKPVILSTGMATLDEVERAVTALGPSLAALLHCVSTYPAASDSANLQSIGILRTHFNTAAGWSDHTVDPATILEAAGTWRSEWIEMHLDLDGSGAEAAAGHCWLPDAAANVIREAATTTGAAASRLDAAAIKAPVEAELNSRDWRADPTDGMRPRRALRAQWQPQ